MSNYHIKNLEEYFQVYRKSVREPENFWEEVAEEHFTWRKKWDNVLSWDFNKPEVKWFENAKLNIIQFFPNKVPWWKEIKHRYFLQVECLL